MLKTYYKSAPNSEMKIEESIKKGALLRVVTSDEDTIKSYAKKLNLDEDALLDGIDLHESPRIEHEGSVTYLYVRYCEPSGRLTSTEPLLIINTPDNIITVARKPVSAVEELLKDKTLVTSQSISITLQILVKINRGYRNHINGVTKQIFATRNRLERRIISNEDVLGFIDTEEDLNEFLAALMPYGIVLRALMHGKYLKMNEDERDLIEDLELSTNELIDLTKSRLKTMQNIRESYNTIATNNLNKVFKRLTSITIFLMIPTIVSGFYGMNVKLPLSDREDGFIILGLLTILFVGFVVYIFNKKSWL